jgi:heme-degrading monooxygenase HmoA
VPLVRRQRLTAEDIASLPWQQRRRPLVCGRLTIIEGRLDRVDNLPEPQEETIPREDEMPGLRALYCLIDRSTGRAASLSIWNSEEDMQASEERPSSGSGDSEREERSTPNGISKTARCG